MKKFVSIVLALALVLSLCTVAFAVTSEELTADDKYKIVKVETGDNESDGKTITKVFGGTTTTYDGKTGEKTVKVSPDTYTVHGDNINVYYETAMDVAEYRLQKGNTVVCYLGKTTGNVDKIVAADTVTKVLEKKEDLDCGDYTALADGDLYVVDADTVYAEGTANYVLYNGKVIAVGTEINTDAVQPHDYAVANKKSACAYNAKGKVVSFTCGLCGKTFTVVDKMAADYTGDFHKVNVDGSKLDKLYVLLGAAAAAETTTTTTTVDSSKTFDAGVAMYVGLSLMSVAGSAVVIGKKKEF